MVNISTTRAEGSQFVTERPLVWKKNMETSDFLAAEYGKDFFSPRSLKITKNEDDLTQKRRQPIVKNEDDLIQKTKTT